MNETRETALNAAIGVWAIERGPADASRADVRRILRIADRFAAWLDWPNPAVALAFAVGEVRPITERHSSMALQVPVGYEFDIVVSPTDIEGNAVPDALTWTISDTTNTTLAVDDATTLKVTIQVLAPSTGVVVTATDATGLTGTLDFDAVPDVVTALALAPSTPVKIPAA